MRPPLRTTRSSARVDTSFSSNAPDLACDAKHAPAPAPATRSCSPAKRLRHRMTGAQLKRLEEAFQRSQYPSKDEKKRLAGTLDMYVLVRMCAYIDLTGHHADLQTVTIWFQNRRQLNKKTVTASSKGAARAKQSRSRSLSPSVSDSGSSSSVDSSSGRVPLDAVDPNQTRKRRSNYRVVNRRPPPLFIPYSTSAVSSAPDHVKSADLHRLLPSSPVEPAESPARGDAYYEELRRQKAWTLDSVCAKDRDLKKWKQQQQRRVDEEEEDSDDGEDYQEMDVDVVEASEDDGDGETEMEEQPSLSPTIFAYTFIPKVEVTPALSAKYHEDVVEGASMLLGLQSSRRIFVIRSQAHA